MPHETAIGYCRVSTHEQAARGLSLDDQEARIKKYCELKGFELLEIGRDEGVSGSIPIIKRPQGKLILELSADNIIATRLDRMFRSTVDCLQWTKQFRDDGTALHLIDFGGQALDTSSAYGQFFITVMAASAELERNITAERIRAVLAHKRAKGERVGSEPYGMKVGPDGKTLIPDEAEQQVVQLIGSLIEGKFSLREVVQYLNDAEIEARGQKWHLTTVARVKKRYYDDID